MIDIAAAICDRMEARMDAVCRDGSSIAPNQPSGRCEASSRLVMPELQRRERLRTAYAGKTLRDNTG